MIQFQYLFSILAILQEYEPDYRTAKRKGKWETQATVGEASCEHQGRGCKEVEDPAVHCTDHRHEESREDRAAIRMWARNTKSRHEHLEQEG